MSVAVKDMDDKINTLTKSAYQDSLKLLIRKNVLIMKQNNFDDAMNKFGEFMEQTRFFINDGKIDSLEFTALKNMVK